MGIQCFLVVLGLVFSGIISQLLPHPPNFTLINSIALFGTCYLGSRTLSFATVFGIMLINDIIFGFHSTMPFVYFSLSLIILMGDRLKGGHISLSFLPLACSLSSLLFFLITNLGMWMTSPLYPKTLVGLKLCYLAAIPFFVNQLLGDLIYGMLFYCIGQLYNIRVQNPLSINS